MTDFPDAVFEGEETKAHGGHCPIHDTGWISNDPNLGCPRCHDEGPKVVAPIKDQACQKCGSFTWTNAREESGAIVECDQCDNGKVKWDQAHEGAYRTLELNGVKFIEIGAVSDLQDATEAMAMDLVHYLKENGKAKLLLPTSPRGQMYRRFMLTIARWIEFKESFFGEKPSKEESTIIKG